MISSGVALLRESATRGRFETELEAVSHCFRNRVHRDVDAIDRMALDTFSQCPAGKTDDAIAGRLNLRRLVLMP
jgi:hypothetical protein